MKGAEKDQHFRTVWRMAHRSLKQVHGFRRMGSFDPLRDEWKYSCNF